MERPEFISTSTGQIIPTDWRKLPPALKEKFYERLRARREEIAQSKIELEKFAPTRFDPAVYIRDRLKCELWHSEHGETSQADVIDHYALVLKQLHEQRDYERGLLTESELQYWTPGDEIQNWISVDAGHNVGKTFLAAAIISHFFDSFPSIGYCFAPSDEQINDLLFKEIRTQRADKGLPGTVLEGRPRINHSSNHFIKGKATNNSNNTGTERAQGQHGEYLIFVIDEAEGVPGFVYDAVRSMSSGGICVVVILRNPRTTTCEAHKIRREPNCKAFRISCLDHPNVMRDREIIPGSVRREYVLNMLDGCEKVDEHSPDDYTFELPWDRNLIYRPSLEFLWRVLGIASAKGTDNTFCPPGRYEAACTRQAYDGDDPLDAWLGIDAARYGNDKGTIYIRHAGRVWKETEISRQDGFEYYLKAKAACVKMHGRGVRRIRVRMDAGGGYHSTCCDNLRRDAELMELFREKFDIVEVHNNGKPRNIEKFADTVTEMYWYAGEALKALRLDSPSPKLERDLCERKYEYVIKTRGGKTRLDVKRLEAKEKFKDRFNESPDDGDGFVLCVASDEIARPRVLEWA